MSKLLLLVLITSVQLRANQIDFIQNDLETARNQAQREQKLVLVHFYASWCTPCHLMDETTWVDPDVVDYVSQNCVPVKIDYDALDGVSYRQHFEVSRLPTTILLDACGKEITRYENGVSASRMVQWIQLFNQPNYRRCGPYQTVALPGYSRSDSIEMPENQPVKTEFFRQPQNASSPTIVEKLKISSPLTIENVPELTTQVPSGKEIAEKLLRYQQQQKNQKPQPESPKTYPSNAFATAPQKPNLPPSPTTYFDEKPTFVGPPESKPYAEAPAPSPASKPKIERPAGKPVQWVAPPQSGFSVQVVACNSAEKAEEIKNSCLQNYKKPVAVAAPASDSDKFYRVMVGFFDNKNEAEKFKKIVRQTYKDAFVRAWATY